MATRSAVGIMQEAAMRDIEKALGIILPSQGRDPELLHAQQLQVIADALKARETAQPITNYAVGLDLANGESMTGKVIIEPPTDEGDTKVLAPVVTQKRKPNPKQRA